LNKNTSGTSTAQASNNGTWLSAYLPEATGLRPDALT
jgi:hypothetical protein